ncbi:TetR/AcrR family transcriptional regulator [Reinekea sp.]|uniref:TetR/AcrR family transcriptional regulator n=1 Tax=Reinekea sp. TaxID=1970455 RepID=UPI002580952B|nr:TetR/AcrR family transcriptional regulator [Reinekea sp.]
MTDTREQLQDRAEYYIRRGGYNSFSFRDLANDLGMKSASVHYHFPTKADLGASVARRYTERFIGSLKQGITDSSTAGDYVELLILVFHREMTQTRQLCLFAILSAEKQLLSEAIQEAITTFYQLVLNWLIEAFARDMPADSAEQRAIQVFATLQGALLGAHALKNRKYFYIAVETLYLDLFYRVLDLPK